MKIQGFYLCTEKSLRYTKNGDLYIDLEVRDKTGHIHAKIWDKVEELLFKISSIILKVFESIISIVLCHSTPLAVLPLHKIFLLL